MSKQGFLHSVFSVLCLLGLLFNPEDVGSMLLSNISELLPDRKVSDPKRQVLYNVCTSDVPQKVVDCKIM
jgi:hypothetical protein